MSVTNLLAPIYLLFPSDYISLCSGQSLSLFTFLFGFERSVPFLPLVRAYFFCWEAYVDWALPSVRAPCSSSTWSPPAPRRAWGGWRASLLWWPRLSSSPPPWGHQLSRPSAVVAGGSGAASFRWCRFLQVPNLPAFDVGLGLLPFELLYYYLSDHVLGLFLRKLYLSELSYHYD